MIRLRWMLVAGLIVATSSRGTAQTPRATATMAAADSVRWARVTYLAGRSVYVDAGRDDGLEVGATVVVVRRGAAVASLRTTVVTSRRASCEIVSGDSSSVAVGDSVRFVISATARVANVGAVRDTTGGPARVPPASAEDSGPATQPRVAESSRSLRSAGIRGRVGVRYLVVSENEAGTRFSQPSADVRLEGTRIGGSPFGVMIDARGRRTVGTRPDSGTMRADTRAHVYRAALSLGTPGGGRIAVGRQFSEAFANVSLYDGISVELNRRRWGSGAFAGTQPAPSTMGYSRDVREYGAYVQTHNETGGARQWAVTFGGIGSYHTTGTNREFAFGQVVVSSPRFSLFAAQEIDYNRGWKAAEGERTLQPTSTFVTAHARPAESVTLQAGFDTRRNVRLWRDRENPETEFDDRFRQGVWGGVSLRGGSHVRLSADVRSSDAGGLSGGRAVAASGTIDLDRVGWSMLGTRARSTRYTSPWLEGWLHSGSIAVSPFGGQLRFELEAGVRSEANRPGVSVTGSLGNDRVQWLTLDTEVALGRSWYLTMTGTRESGGWAPINQGYGSLSWRF